MTKRLLLTPFILLFILGTTIKGNAQDSKLGHVKLQKVLRAMPEHKKAQKKMEEFQKRLQNNIEQMNAEYQTKVSEFQEGQEDMTDTERESMMSQIQDLQKRIQKAQSQAQQDVRKQEEELLMPLIEKAQNAIDKVAEEKGYTYVFNSTDQGIMGGSPLLYEGGKDLTKAVKKELGLLGNNSGKGKAEGK